MKNCRITYGTLRPLGRRPRQRFQSASFGSHNDDLTQAFRRALPVSKYPQCGIGGSLARRQMLRDLSSWLLGCRVAVRQVSARPAHGDSLRLSRPPYRTVQPSDGVDAEYLLAIQFFAKADPWRFRITASILARG